MRFFTTELNKFKQIKHLKHGYKKQPLHYGDYVWIFFILSYTLLVLKSGSTFLIIYETYTKQLWHPRLSEYGITDELKHIIVNCSTQHITYFIRKYWAYAVNWKIDVHISILAEHFYMFLNYKFMDKYYSTAIICKTLRGLSTITNY